MLGPWYWKGPGGSCLVSKALRSVNSELLGSRRKKVSQKKNSTNSFLFFFSLCFLRLCFFHSEIPEF